MKKVLSYFILLTVGFFTTLPLEVVAQGEERFIETELFGYPSFTIDNYDNLTTNMIAGGMVLESLNHFEENYKDLMDLGVVYRGYHTLSDNYGNTEDIFTYVLYISPETINKINFENWDPTSNQFFEIADGSYLHPIFDKYELYSEQKVNKDDLPQAFTGIINGTFVNEHTMGRNPTDRPDLSNVETTDDTFDVVYGKLNEDGKRLINDIPMYEADDSDHQITFMLTDGEITTVTIEFPESKLNLNEDTLEIESIIKQYTSEDAELIEDITEGELIQYIYESPSKLLSYVVEIGTLDGREVYGVYIGKAY